MKLFLFAVIALLAQIATSWSINGHLYVAAVAEEVLLDLWPEDYQRALDLLQVLKDDDPDFTYREVNHTFVECSTFADDWKYRGESWQGSYHYVNLPFYDEGTTEDQFSWTWKTKNITGGLEQIIAWIREDPTLFNYTEGGIYQRMQSDYIDKENWEELGKSYALRMLIHLVGDIVQPLHNIARYTLDYESGDAGANGFKLERKYSVSSLHSLWDKVLYEERYNIRRPIEQDDWSEIEAVVATMKSNFTEVYEDRTRWHQMNIEALSLEGFELAKTLYDGVTEFELPPTEYLQNFIPLAYE